MKPEGSEDKGLSDPTYSFKDFSTQLSAGRLRWLASILAVAGLSLFLLMLTNEKEPQIDFLIHVRGRTALWTAGIAFGIWTALAVVNWRAWWVSKRRR